MTKEILNYIFVTAGIISSLYILSAWPTIIILLGFGIVDELRRLNG